MGPRQRLTGRHPDHRAERQQLRGHPNRPGPPALRVVGQLGTRLGPGQQGGYALLGRQGTQTPIAQPQVDGVPGRREGRRHSVQPREIGEGIRHH